jgi:tetratricopeptide (TPR) repeat protein
MDDLKGLIKSLNKREVDLVRLIYGRNVNNEERLRLELFDLIRSNIKQPGSDIIRLFGYKGSKSAFSHLKTRLRNDILNIILFQESNKKFRSPMFSASFETKKKMAFAELLYRRGLVEIGDDIIQEGVLMSEKYEFYAERYILLDFQRVTHGITKGGSVIDWFNKEIGNSIKVIEANSKVVSLFYSFTIRYLGKKNLSKEKLEEAYLILLEMKSIYTSHPNPRIGFWFHRAALSYYSYILEYSSAISHGKILVELTESNPSLYSPVNLAGASKDLAEICISGRQFELAVSYSLKALNLFNPQLNNFLLTLENYFQACFLFGDFTKANDVIQRARIHPRFQINKVNIAKWDYFHACLCFRNGEFKMALELLNRNHSIFIHDKGEFQLGYRLMILMVYVEQFRFDELEFELDSFRKSVSKLKGFKKDRIKLIIKILNKFVGYGFNFELVINKNRVIFDSVLIDQNLLWQPLGFELINFFDWIYLKIDEN